MNKRSILLGVLAAFGPVAWLGIAQYTSGATDQQEITRVFAVENMTCAACPITVKKAISQVDGVKNVEVDFEAKTATATFDPEKTSCNTIAQAPTAVGFPATLMSVGEHEKDC